LISAHCVRKSKGEGIRDAAGAVAKLGKKTTKVVLIALSKKAHTPSELGVCDEFA